MDKTITFKNGKTIKIKQEMADILHKKIDYGGIKFQCFWSDVEGKSDMIINISEIVCIE